MLYKSNLLTLRTIGYSWYIVMSIVYGPKWPFYSCRDYVGLLGTGFMQVLYLGRAPLTKETLLDFQKWRRVTRHPLVFRELTGSQRTPGFGASHMQLFNCFLKKMQLFDLKKIKKIVFFHFYLHYLESQALTYY